MVIFKHSSVFDELKSFVITILLKIRYDQLELSVIGIEKSFWEKLEQVHKSRRDNIMVEIQT